MPVVKPSFDPNQFYYGGGQDLLSPTSDVSLEGAPAPLLPALTDPKEELGFDPTTAFGPQPSEAAKGLMSSWNQTQAFAGGTIALGAEALKKIAPEIAVPALDAASQWGLDVYKEKMEETEPGQRLGPKVARIEDIGSVGDFGDWVAYYGSQGVGQLAQIALTSGGTGLAAKAMLGSTVKKVAEAELGKVIGGRVVDKATKEAAQKAIQKTFLRGAVGGAAAQSFSMEGGSQFASQVLEGKNPQDVVGEAAAVGGINAAIELLPFGLAAKYLGIGTDAVKTSVWQTIKDTPELSKKAIELAKSALKAGAVGGAAEGVTEGIQELVQIAGDRWANKEGIYGSLGPEEWSRIANVSAAAFLPGSAIGAAVGPFEGAAQRKPTTVPQELPSEIPPGGVVAPPQVEPTAEPVQAGEPSALQVPADWTPISENVYQKGTNQLVYDPETDVWSVLDMAGAKPPAQFDTFDEAVSSIEGVLPNAVLVPGDQEASAGVPSQEAVFEGAGQTGVGGEVGPTVVPAAEAVVPTPEEQLGVSEGTGTAGAAQPANVVYDVVRDGQVVGAVGSPTKLNEWAQRNNVSPGDVSLTPREVVANGLQEEGQGAGQAAIKEDALAVKTAYDTHIQDGLVAEDNFDEKYGSGAYAAYVDKGILPQGIQESTAQQPALKPDVSNLIPEEPAQSEATTLQEPSYNKSEFLDPSPYPPNAIVKQPNGTYAIKGWFGSKEFSGFYDSVEGAQQHLDLGKMGAVNYPVFEEAKPLPPASSLPVGRQDKVKYFANFLGDAKPDVILHGPNGKVLAIAHKPNGANKDFFAEWKPGDHYPSINSMGSVGNSVSEQSWLNKGYKPIQASEAILKTWPNKQHVWAKELLEPTTKKPDVSNLTPEEPAGWKQTNPEQWVYGAKLVDGQWAGGYIVDYNAGKYELLDSQGEKLNEYKSLEEAQRSAEIRTLSNENQGAFEEIAAELGMTKGDVESFSVLAALKDVIPGAFATIKNTIQDSYGDWKELNNTIANNEKLSGMINAFQARWSPEDALQMFGKKEHAKHAGSKVYEFYTKFLNPYVVDYNGKSWSSSDFADKQNYAKSHGYDGLIVLNVHDMGVKGTQIQVWDPIQVKTRELENIGYSLTDAILYHTKVSEGKQVSVEEVEQTIATEFGSNWLNRAKRAGLIEIHPGVSDTGASGTFDPTTGKMHLYAGSMPVDGTIAGVVLHEGVHQNLETMLGSRVFGEYARKLDALWAKGDETAVSAGTTALNRVAEKLGIANRLSDVALSKEELAAEAKKVKEAVNSTPEGRSMLAQEKLAYYVQFAKDGENKGLFRSIINALKAAWISSSIGQAFAKAGLMPQLTDELMVQLARRATRLSVKLAEDMENLGALTPEEFFKSGRFAETFPGIKLPEYDKQLPWEKGVVEAATLQSKIGTLPAIERTSEMLAQTTTVEIRFAQDMLAQVGFLEREAKKLGYKGLEDLPEKEFDKAAGEWRKAHVLESRAPDTKEFKAWFGDSKIVDEDGKPLVVYHGTKRDFIEFKSAYPDGLLFLTTNPKFAESWPVGSGGLREPSEENAAEFEKLYKREHEIANNLFGPIEDYNKRSGADNAAILEQVQVQFEKETGYRSPFDYQNKAGIRVMPMYLSIKNPFDPRVDWPKMESFIRENVSAGLVKQGAHKAGNWVIYESKAVIDELKRKGYDGIWLAENIDGPHETIAAFYPEQIKSAVGNSGAFEIGNPKYLESSLSSYIPKYLLTDPTSSNVDEVNRPGKLQMLLADYVDRFNDILKKSGAVYEKFGAVAAKKGAAVQEHHDRYSKPFLALVKKWGRSVEETGLAIAARHVVEDNVNRKLAEDNSLGYVRRLEKAKANNKYLLTPSLRTQLKTERTNVQNGLLPDGSQHIDLNGNLRDLNKSEIKQEMYNLVEKYMALTKDSTDQYDLWVEWENLKHHASGFSVGDTMSPEFLRKDNKGEYIVQNAPARIFVSRKAEDHYTPSVKADPTFNEIATLWDALVREELDVRLEGGLIQKEEYDALTTRYKHFAPLRRIEFDLPEEVSKLLGQGTGPGKGMMARAGSSIPMDPVHVMQNGLAKLDAATSAAERNKAMNFLANQIYSDKAKWEEWFTISEDKSYATRDKNGFIVEQQSTQTSDTDMRFIRDGKRLLITPARANIRAAQFARAVNNLDAKNLDGPMALMGAANQWIRAVNITLSPVFGVTNMIRDPLTAAYNLQASEAKEYAGAIFKEYKNSLRALKKVFLDGVTDPADKDVQRVKAFQKAGGQASFVGSLKPMDSSWNSFEAMAKRRDTPLLGTMIQWGKPKLEFMENLNEVFENVMRLSTYTVLKDKVANISDERAARIAREVTTDFTRKGFKAQALGTWWLFFNATVSGNYTVVRNLMESKKLQAAVGGTIAFAFLLDSMGRAFSDDEDGDGRSDWDSIPEWEKEKYIHFPFKIGGVYPKIPAPWVYNVVWRFGQMLGEYAGGQRDIPSIFADTAGNMVDAFNPLGGTATTPAQMLAPTALDPLMQILENKDFAGNPLGPEGFPGAGKRPDAFMAWDTMPEGYKAAARWINDLTGGTPAESGRVDLRPSTYKVLADMLMGSSGRFIQQVFSLPVDVFEGKELTQRTFPLARQFTSVATDPMESQLYHERLARTYGAHQTELRYRSGPDRDFAALNELRTTRSGELRMYDFAKDVERQISSLRKQMNLAVTRGDEKGAEAIKARMDLARQRFNQTWVRRVGN